jgi:putative DNA primase/helicase
VTTAPAWAVFEARGLVKRGEQWDAICPGHKDNRRSLSIKIAEDGRLLMTCFAGCAVADICKAVGVKMAELWPPTERMNTPRTPPAKVVARYDYRDESGALLYQVERTDPKGFRQRKPDGQGWTYSLGDVRRVLYRLPELLAAPGRVCILVEGEKDCLAWVKLGMLATCCSGGADAWRGEYADSLQDRTTIIIPDNDEAGRQFAAKAKTWLMRGIIVPLPGLAPKGDSSDWIAAGGTAKQLAELARARARAEIANAGEILRSLGG